MPPTPVTVRELLDRHAAAFFDAYGVLNDSEGALPGAADIVATLEREHRAYLVLTNDASRLPETLATRFSRFGLPIPVERILSSGDLLRAHFASAGLAGSRCVVLGPADSTTLVRRAGGEVIAADPAGTVDALVVCDDDGYPFLETVEAALTMVLRTLDAGRTPALVLPNPDLIYPKRGGAFGFTAGTIASMIEAAIRVRAPRLDLAFARLGKPFAPLFDEACRRVGTRDAVMFGDQLGTDVRGANDFGIASALVGWGLTRLEDLHDEGVAPTYVVPSPKL